MIFIKTGFVSVGTEELVRHLNRVLRLVESSFTAYQARVGNPVRAPGDGTFADLLARSAAEDRRAAQALRELILNLGGVPGEGGFPLEHSHYNYLTLRYLAPHFARTRARDTLAVRQELDVSREHPSALEILTQLHPRWEKEAQEWAALAASPPAASAGPGSEPGPGA